MLTDERKKQLIDHPDIEMTDEELNWILHGDKMPCSRCKGTGWLEAIDGWRDGSWITSRPCPTCRGDGSL